MPVNLPPVIYNKIKNNENGMLNNLDEINGDTSTELNFNKISLP